MATTHVLSALTRKYASPLSELRQCEGRSDKLRADLAHLEATIRLCRADWDSGTARASLPRLPSRWSENGAGVGYAELARRLTKMGLPETEGSITVKINRGGFSAWFLIAAIEAIGAASLRLSDT